MGKGEGFLLIKTVPTHQKCFDYTVVNPFV